MRGRLKILMMRKSLVKYILNIAGFRIICGHWIYVSKIYKDSIVLDLGANEGAFSKEVSTKYKAKCYAVEPNKNLLTNILDSNIVKLNYAIAKENGPVKFYVSNNSEASSVIKEFETTWGNKDINVVEGISWDSLIDLLNFTDKKISLVKVDIEGSELDLIDSWNLKNLKDVEQITIEFHDWLNIALHERTIRSIKNLFH